MKRRFTSLLLSALLVIAAVVNVQAASNDAIVAAETLHRLGLFNGVGDDAQGKPNYALDRTPTRHEAVTMLVRLLGKEDEALAGNWNTPFVDVADWAKPYVGYAYANGLTDGTGATTYSGNLSITATQYLTFILRALGYSSNSDFQWDKAWLLSDSLGITSGEYSSNAAFLRADVALISKAALAVYHKGFGVTLSDKLISEGVFSKEQYEKALIQSAPSSDNATNTAGTDGLVYSEFPSILSFENASKSTPLTHQSDISYPEFGIYTHCYTYNTPTLAEAEQLAEKYANWLITKGYTLMRKEDDPIIEQTMGTDIIYELKDPTGDYMVSVKSNYRWGDNAMEYSVTVTIDYSAGQSSAMDTQTGKMQSPVKITNIRSKMNSVGGVVFTFDIENRSDKTIKYVTPSWHCLNAVGDIIYDRIDLSDRFAGRITGPIAPGEKVTELQNERPFYNSSFANNIRLIEIVIDYMDGSMEIVNPYKYYDYWDLS